MSWLVILTIGGSIGGIWAICNAVDKTNEKLDAIIAYLEFIVDKEYGTGYRLNRK